jgi:hypothetical protein
MLTASVIVSISSAAMATFDQLSQESVPRLICEVRLFIDSAISNAQFVCGHASILRAQQRAPSSEAKFVRGDCTLANIRARIPSNFR